MGLHASASLLPSGAVCAQVCASVSPGLGGLRAGGCLHPAIADHSHLSPLGLFFLPFPWCLRHHTRASPGDALLSLSAGDTVPGRCLCGIPVPAGHCPPRTPGWGRGPVLCPGHHCFHALCPLLHTWHPRPRTVLVLRSGPLASGISCSGCIGDTLDGPLAGPSSCPVGVLWLRSQVVLWVSGLGFLICQVGALSLRGRKYCGVQCEAVWPLLRCPPAHLYVPGDGLGTRCTHSSAPGSVVRRTPICQVPGFCLHYGRPGW